MSLVAYSKIILNITRPTLQQTRSDIFVRRLQKEAEEEKKKESRIFSQAAYFSKIILNLKL
jgi:hypothetical protein